MITNTNRTECSLLQNKSGGALAYGDFVIIDTSNPNAVVTTTTAGFVNGQIAVVLDKNGIANNAYGMFATGGWVPRVNLDASATAGQLFKLSSTAKQATPHSAPAVSGDFGQVLEAGTNPPALLFGSPVQVFSGSASYFAPTGLTGATQLSRYVGATTSGAPVSGTFSGGDWVIDLTGKIWICTAGGSPGTWTQLGGGGGAGVWWTTTNPTTPTWAWVNQGSATIVTGTDKAYLYQVAGVGVNIRLRKVTAPATPYKVTAAFVFNPGRNTGNCQFGLFFRESSSGKLSAISLLVGGAIEVQKWNSPTSFSATYFSATGSWRYSGMIWLRLEDDGTNRKYSMSTDGENFIEYHSVGRTDFLTANEIGWGLDIDTGNQNAGLTLLSWKVE